MLRYAALFLLVGTGCGPAPVAGPCDQEKRADALQPGLEKSGATLRVQLLQVDSPPIKGDNTWTVLVRDRAGAAVSGAQLLTSPYMPDHQHGTSIKAVTSPLPDAGQYRIAPINLFMSAYWEVRMAVTPPGGSADQVVFGVCIDG